MKKQTLFSLFFYCTTLSAQIDYSQVSVPQEVGLEFMRVSSDGDYVFMPQVKSSNNLIKWEADRVLDIDNNGTHIAYLSKRGNTTNIFIKDISKQGSSIQRTKRAVIKDFVYSPDGKFICFSEKIGKEQQVFQTDASKGYVCRQFTSGAIDSSPIYSLDMSQIFFSRKEKRGATIWSYNIKNNFLWKL